MSHPVERPPAQQWSCAVLAIRLAAMAVLGWWLVDDLSSRSASSPVVIVIVATSAAAMATIWWPVPGAWSGVVAMFAAGLIGTWGYGFNAAVVAGITVGATGARRAAIAIAACHAAWLAWILSMYERLAISPIVAMVVVLYLAVPWGLGLLVRRLLWVRRARLARIAALEEENASIKRDERAALARELHDVVGHHLSVITLQVLGHRDSEDPDEIAAALGRVAAASRTALTELRTMVSLLTGAGPPETQLRQLSTPTSAAVTLQVALADAGFDPDISVPSSMDRLDPTLRLTVCRVLQEAVTNMLRHARPGTRCTVRAVEQSDGSVLITAANEMSPEENASMSHLSQGHGVLGLQERLELLGGSLFSGPRDAGWVVEAQLPRRVAP